MAQQFRRIDPEVRKRMEEWRKTKEEQERRKKSEQTFNAAVFFLFIVALAVLGLLGKLR